MRVSSHVNQQEHVKQQEAAGSKIVCFLHSKMLPFKKFSGLREPRWGAQRPPDPHLQSTSIHRWLRPCRIQISGAVVRHACAMRYQHDLRPSFEGQSCLAARYLSGFSVIHENLKNLSSLFLSMSHVQVNTKQRNFLVGGR